MTDIDELYLLADELRAIASQGLLHGQNSFDKERYERVLSASARLLAAVDGASPDDVMTTYRDNLSHVSPLVGADAAVFRNGRLLLMRRDDNGLWAMPGGAVEVGETVAEAAVRELEEETGLQGRAVRLLGIWDSRRVGSRVKAHLYHCCLLCEAEGEPHTTAEATEVGWFAADELPELAPGHSVMVPEVLRIVTQRLNAWFDS